MRRHVALFLLFTALVSLAGMLRTPPRARAQTAVSHVVLIMEENHSYSAAMSGMPYLKSLASTYATATNYWAIGFPSEPNYMALTSGEPVPGKDCAPSSSCQSSYANIFEQTASWHVLAESMPSACDKSNSGEYVPRHTAAPYYTDLSTCKTYDVPYSASTTPNISAKFTLIAPNLLHDAHDGTLAAADTWLKGVMAKILATTQYKSGNTLVEVAFDSGSGNCGSTCQSQVALVLVNPQLSKVVISSKYSHYSLLRLNEEILGVSPLGHASSAADMRAALGL